ncbi:MAG: orotidine 5'-phosphate decarboxylase [bacterium]
MENFKEKVIIALDYSDLKPVRQLLEKLKGRAFFYKIGFELFTSCGMKSVELVKDYGGKIFLDLKFHDIPNTVYKAVKSAGKSGADIINVHASGGADMMKAAKRGGEEASGITGKHIDIIAVTVLTNLSNADISRIFYNLGTLNMPDGGISAGSGRETLNASGGENGAGIAYDLALHLAGLAKASGLDGVVCSGHESLKIKNAFGADFKTVTPGIRLKAETGDQKRVMAPSAAFCAGADYIVVGREITNADNPADALSDVYSDIEKSICK